MTNTTHGADAPAPHPGGIEPHLDLDTLLHHTELPETAFSRAVDPIVRKLGEWSSLLWPLLVAIITINVVMRYAFGTGLIEFEELQWHIYAISFLFGLAWILQIDDHVRIDVLSEHFKFRNQCWIELGGILIALLPFIAVVIWFSVPFVNYSFTIHEISEAPGGLTHRWIMKAVLPLSFLLLGIATIARLTRVLKALFTKNPASAN